MKERTQTLDEERFDLVWVDKGREPQCAPNPDFPDGVDVDVTMGQRPACRSTAKGDCEEGRSQALEEIGIHLT